MADILDKIVSARRKAVEKRKSLYPVQLLEESIYYATPVVSLSKYLRRKDRAGIIAEFKRQSPSAGIINRTASVEKTSIGYMQSGASALSVLTEPEFFGGNNADLTEARKYNFCPILRKDFIIDEYQIIEAKSIGADAILLIASCLSIAEIKQFAALARSIGLEVLFEVHSAEELEKVNDYINVVGVNNRNLNDFSVSIDTSLALLPKIPEQFVKISESGLSKAESLVTLKQAGFDGFLIGGSFMEQAEPDLACGALIKEYYQALSKVEKTEA